MPSGVPRIPEPREWVLVKNCSRCGERKPWAKFPPRKYWPDGAVRVVAAHCSACDSEMSRARQRLYREVRDERFRRYEARRIEWQRRKRAALKLERTSGGQRIPSGPLAAAVRAAASEDEGLTLLAEQCGMSERILRRVAAQENVTLRLADEICTRMGVRIYDLYPELEEVAA